jgi:fatty acid desaturase
MALGAAKRLDRIEIDKPGFSSKTGSWANGSVNDVSRLWVHSRAVGSRQQLKDLHRPRNIISLVTIFVDFLSIFLMVALVTYWSFVWVLPALVVIGSRQRALVVLAHDAAHYALLSRRFWNDAVARWILCAPMLMSFDKFRSMHLAHHINLGDPDHDTDFLHSEVGIKAGWLNVFLETALCFDNWIVSGLLGDFVMKSQAVWKYSVTVWATILTALVAIFGSQFTCVFLLLWVASRATIYHLIISFVIISDHVGLYPERVIIGFARNHSRVGLFRHLIHPHNNGFHLTHHLLPGLPWHALGKADKILLLWPDYSEAAHCDSYFWGLNSAIKSWTRSSDKIAEE